ncbi:hypothetical protein UT300019_22140 [Clostridium sp. CTA-19]
MNFLFAYALTMGGTGLEHTYVSSSDGKVWRCFGRNSGGRMIANHIGSSKQADIMSKPSETNETGIRYGIDGVCHQAANRILYFTSEVVDKAGGYSASRAMYGIYGTNYKYSSDIFVTNRDIAINIVDWKDWVKLGGKLTSAPAAYFYDFGRLDVFYRGEDNSLRYRYWKDSWSSETNLGGKLASDPAVVSWGVNRLDLFYKGEDNALKHRWWNGSSWSNEENLGGNLTSAPTVSSWDIGRLDVFYKGSDNGLMHKFWNGSSWSNEENLGGNLTSDPSAVSWDRNRIDVFYRNQNNLLIHKFWNGSSWSNEENLGIRISSSPSAASWKQKNLCVFYKGDDNALYYMQWAGIWTNSIKIGGELKFKPSAVCSEKNRSRIDVFVCGTDDNLYQISTYYK